MRSSWGIAAVATVWSATGCAARGMTLTAEKMVADVRTEQLQSTLWNLNHIANQHGGNRAFGRPGYKASVDFVLERAQKRFGRKFDTFLQPFNHTYEELRDAWVTGPEGEDVPVVSPVFNSATPPEGITAKLVNTPVDYHHGSMCYEDMWDDIDAVGKIVLIRRGGCDVALKARYAQMNGAVGVILYHHIVIKIHKPTLGSNNINRLIPVGIIHSDIGKRWAARLDASEELEITLMIDGIVEKRTSWNIISQTKQGDPNRVIMLGAHLDSVPEGPGVNDDGTGVAALLEIMESVERYDDYPHSIRFAWWGAEEAGLVGSLYYTSNLDSKEADKIKYYFNYDMIGSPNPKFELMSDSHSGIGAQLLEDYLTKEGKEVSYMLFDNRSDYAGFVDLGIPTTGLFTGEEEHDPCYHQACDTIDNVHLEAFTINTKAAAHALGTLATSLEGVPKRLNITPNLRGRSKMTHNFQRWQKLAAQAQRGQSCSHRHKSETV